MTGSRAGMPLSPRQLQALTAAATGATLTEIGDQLGITREHVSMLLSNAYRRLDVTHLPRNQRRAAAVRAAVRRGLIPNPAEETTR
jgi:DNA-binding CsgD family transcriptional regulator